MDVAAIGTNGLGSVFESAGRPGDLAGDGRLPPERRQGRDDLARDPACTRRAAQDDLHGRGPQAGTRDRSDVQFHSALDNISAPRINQEVLERWDRLKVPVTFNSKLVAVDIGARRATVTSPEGERTELDYDFMYVAADARA